MCGVIIEPQVPTQALSPGHFPLLDHKTGVGIRVSPILLGIDNGYQKLVSLIPSP